MSVSKKVAVVLLGWNGRHFMEQFLPALIKHTDPELCDIILADNASTDDSVSFVGKNYPGIRVIENGRNGGYAGGYNDALKKVSAEYYVLLNQDIEVTEGWIAHVIAEMDRRKNIGAAQPKILDYRRKEYFEYAGAAGGHLDRFGFAFCRGRIFDTTEKDEQHYNAIAPIFWASGACMFVRAEAFWRAGALDEDFFAHQEEIDLCWRMRSLGYENICVPASVVYHVGGGSLPYGNPRKTYLNFRNNLMMLFKNLPASHLWLTLFLRLRMDDLAAIQMLVKEKSVTGIRAIYKARIDFWRALPQLIRKRKTAPGFSLPDYPHSIVWQYFVRGKKFFRDLPQ